MSTTHQTKLLNEFAQNFRRMAGCPEKQESNTEVWGEREEQLRLLNEARILGWTVKILAVVLIGLAILVLAIRSEAQVVVVDLNIIAQIESSGCVNKVSKRVGDESYGCHQITPILLKEYNQMTKHSYSKADLLNNKISEQIADWYLSKRIPSMLKYYKKPVTIEMVLTAYNMGIGNVIKGKVATNYISKYKRLVRR